MNTLYSPLPTPQEMTALDRAAIACGIPEYTLMENASREALHVLASCRDIRGAVVLLVMGGGNNGGDAACLARHLLDAGARPLVVHTRPLRAYRGVSGQHLRLAKRCGVPFVPIQAWLSQAGVTNLFKEWLAPDIVVDGLLGTGFTGVLREAESGYIQWINRLRNTAFLFAIDIPSGLSGLTGKPCPEAVSAHATVTFHAAKPGLVFPEARQFTGELFIRSIGIPRKVQEAYRPSFQQLSSDTVSFLPVPEGDWHKGKAGRILIVGGSEGLTGAPHLAVRAALRTGAGLVTAACPAGLCSELKGGDPDTMTYGLGTPASRSWTSELAPQVSKKAMEHDVLVLGPGLGRGEAVLDFLRAFLPLPRPVCLLDADALYGLAQAPDLVQFLKPDDILTPHPGEAALLLGTSAACVQEDRVAALRGLVQAAPAVWVLKGAGTLIAAPDEPVTLAPFVVPQLAVGGSGDVLSGCIAALRAQLPSSFQAASLGVCLHARAGERLASRFPRRGNTASEIADALA